MMFLLRMTFWIMLICLLLPDSRQDSARLLTSAGKAVNDMRGFCGRNPDVCRDAQTAATSAFAKVKNGMDIMETWLAETRSVTPTVEAEGAKVEEPSVTKVPLTPARPVPQWDRTLKVDDRQAPWRGPSPKL